MLEDTSASAPTVLQSEAPDVLSWVTLGLIISTQHPEWAHTVNVETKLTKFLPERTNRFGDGFQNLRTINVPV